MLLRYKSAMLQGECVENIFLFVFCILCIKWPVIVNAGRDSNMHLTHTYIYHYLFLSASIYINFIHVGVSRGQKQGDRKSLSSPSFTKLFNKKLDDV